MGFNLKGSNVFYRTNIVLNRGNYFYVGPLLKRPILDQGRTVKVSSY